jgi:hypothetical protein
MLANVQPIPGIVAGAIGLLIFLGLCAVVDFVLAAKDKKESEEIQAAIDRAYESMGKPRR